MEKVPIYSKIQIRIESKIDAPMVDMEATDNTHMTKCAAMATPTSVSALKEVSHAPQRMTRPNGNTLKPMRLRIQRN